KQVFFNPEIIQYQSLDKLLFNQQNTSIFEVTQEVYEKIAYRENSGGIIIVAETKQLILSELALPKNPLILVLESVEKPGNLGAILRTADAAGVDALIVCDAQTDIFNANVIRSSLGCVFTVPLVVSNNQTVIEFLKTNQIQIFATYLEASKPYTAINFNQS